MIRCLLALTLLSPLAAFAQEKGDTRIIVNMKDTANILNRLSALLYDRGYDLHTKDASVGFISTEEREFKSLWVIKARFLVKGKTLIITGDLANFDLNATRRLDFDPIEYRAGLFGNPKSAWEELEEIGLQFGTLTYVQ